MNGGLWYSHITNVRSVKLKDVVSPRVIEVTSSVDFQVRIFLCFLGTVFFEDHSITSIHFNAQFTYDLNCKLIKI